MDKKKRKLEKSILKDEKSTQDIVWEDVIFDEKNAIIGIISQINLINNTKIFEVYTSNDELITTKLDLNLDKNLANNIFIGDIVYLSKENGNYVIKKRKNRVNELSRIKGDADRFGGGNKTKQIIACNIDYGIITASAKNPDFHIGFIDRYNILLEYCNIKPIICITKSDLLKLNDKNLLWYNEKLGIKVFYISVETGEGLIEFKKEIFGKKVVFVGNSGVGKSSLTNYLIGGLYEKTGIVSDKNGQGKHTTTKSNLYKWDENSFIIDTPGIRNLDLYEFSKNKLKLYFKDFLNFQCKYKDCNHILEPDCAIKTAVGKGLISKKRYESYLRMMREL